MMILLFLSLLAIDDTDGTNISEGKQSQMMIAIRKKLISARKL